MIFLEINEFSPDLMSKACDLLDAKNLKKLLALQHTYTTTDDKSERFGLDPWVQWVSIHTGKTSIEHGVNHLGDVPNLKYPQIWETLSNRGLSCGIWGAMNASLGKTKNIKFFFPDPWSFSEIAFPPELNDFLAFPRYYSKNYCDLNKVKVARELIKLIKFCLNPSIAMVLLPIIPKLLKLLIKNRISEYLLFLVFDLVNVTLFAHYYKKTKPNFALLFLNSLAHLQHHKWTIKDGLSHEMRVAFSTFDDILGIIFKIIPIDQPFIVANAFTQFCSYDENEYLYRQKNPDKFLQKAGIVFSHMEQAMTNDGHVFFDSNSQAKNAAEILQKATMNGKNVFHVELDNLKADNERLIMLLRNTTEVI